MGKLSNSFIRSLNYIKIYVVGKLSYLSNAVYFVRDPNLSIVFSGKVIVTS